MDNFLVPVYLGKSSVEKAGKNKGSLDSYYFYSQKNGVGRFVKYSNYPYWAAASNVPDSLVLEDPLESVVNEVQAFVSGKMEFTVIPKTRGRSEVVLRKEVSYNQENGVCKNVAIESHVEAQHPDTTAGEKGKASYPCLETSKSVSTSNLLSSPSKDSKGLSPTSSRNVRKGGAESGSDDLRRLPNLGPDGGFSRGVSGRDSSSTQQSSTSTGESGTRRVSGKRVLGNSGGSQRDVNGDPSMDSPRPGPLDGHVTKRIRRTKEQLASGVSLEDLKAHKEGLS